jgi:hypothetical protein
MNAASFDPLRALRILIEEEVRFIVVGGLAGRAWGSPTITNDLDICYERSAVNLVRLATALRRLEARLRGVSEDVPFQVDDRALKFGDSFTFETIAGPFDCLGTPSGTTGFADLAKNAKELEIGDMRVLFTSLDDLMRMKKAAGRPKDLIELEILAALKEESAG